MCITCNLCIVKFDIEPPKGDGSVKRRDDMDTSLTPKEKVIVGIILFVILGIIATIIDSTKCKYSGCDEKVYKNNYCEQHYKLMQYIDSITTPNNTRSNTKSSSTKSTSSKTSSSSTTKKTSTSNTNKKTANKKTKTTTVTHINGDDKFLYTDPEDYDNPDDFADDAWGIDFEEWDDAYEYWENY